MQSKTEKRVPASNAGLAPKIVVGFTSDRITKCARVSMSIVQRLDGSRVRNEKQFKKTVQKDSSMHGSKQNPYK